MFPLSPAGVVPVHEFRGFAGDPAEEGGDVRVGAQALDRVVVVAQFLLGQNRVDLGVADAVHGHRLAAAIGARDEVVLVQARAGNERAVAERAGWERLVLWRHRWQWGALIARPYWTVGRRAAG